MHSACTSHKDLRFSSFADGSPWTAQLWMKGRVDYEIISMNTRWIAMKNIMGFCFAVSEIILIVILLL